MKSNFVLHTLLLAVFTLPVLAETAADAPNAIKTVRTDADTVVVSQGDVAVTMGDIDIWMLEVPEKDRAGFIRSPERIEQTLQQMLLLKHMARDGRAAGLDQDPLVKAHMALAADRTLARYQRDKVARAIVVPNLEQLARERYLADPAAFREPSFADAVHLLITEKDRSPEQAKALIDELYEQARQDPTQLEEMALKSSEDPSVSGNRGQLRNVNPDTLAPEFAEALKQLKPGELSAPVKTQFGWHLIRLDAFRAGRTPPFDEVKATLVEKLQQEYQYAELRKYTDNLRQQPMQPNPDALGKLPFRYGGEDPLLASPAK